MECHNTKNRLPILNGEAYTLVLPVLVCGEENRKSAGGHRLRRAGLECKAWSRVGKITCAFVCSPFRILLILFCVFMTLTVYLMYLKQAGACCTLNILRQDCCMLIQELLILLS